MRGDAMQTYTTIQSDTWDQIALKAYGSEMTTPALMAENGLRDPDLLAVWRFEYGQTLYVPAPSVPVSQVMALPEYRRTDD